MSEKTVTLFRILCSSAIREILKSPVKAIYDHLGIYDLYGRVVNITLAYSSWLIILKKQDHKCYQFEIGTLVQ